MKSSAMATPKVPELGAALLINQLLIRLRGNKQAASWKSSQKGCKYRSGKHSWER